MKCDVAVVGAGPAGLAVAIEAARRGLFTLVIERRRGPWDKACGEGLLPKGVEALERLGVRRHLAAGNGFPLEGIRYLQEDESAVEGRFCGATGLGLRRLALTDAMRRRALEVGVQLCDGCSVHRVERAASGMRLFASSEEFEAKLLVAADGLHSPLRKTLGLLKVPPKAAARFGMRQHFEVHPWSRFVEVYLSAEAEAYVTPVSATQVGVALLFEKGKWPEQVRFTEMLRRGFPALARRLGDAPPCSTVLGAGPFFQVAQGQVANRAALVGDAAGYRDAITGEGLSLSLCTAEVLGALLPDALNMGATRESLLPYQRSHQRQFRRYALWTGALLALARRPALRRRVIHLLRRWPALFELLLHQAVA